VESPYKHISELYRYEEITYSRGLDESDNVIQGFDMRLELRTFVVLRATAKGVWIKMFGLNKEEKFVHLGAKKQYASPTKEQAMQCYKSRKKRQIEILSYKLDKARKALSLINEQ